MGASIGRAALAALEAEIASLRKSISDIQAEIADMRGESTVGDFIYSSDDAKRCRFCHQSSRTTKMEEWVPQGAPDGTIYLVCSDTRRCNTARSKIP